MALRYRTSPILAFALTVSWCHADAFKEDELAIVPQPKKLKVRAETLELRHIPILLEERTGSYLAAANRLNRQVVSLGGKPLPILTMRQASEKLPATAIVIGRRDGICKPYMVGTDAVQGKGDQAYSIHGWSQGARRFLILSGNGSVGAYYAVTTLLHFIYKEGDRILARQAEVSDWPDWTWRCLTNVDYAYRKNISLFRRDKAAFANGFKQWIDDLADIKVNLLWGANAFGFSYDKLDPKVAAGLAWVKPLLDYARDRGVYAFTQCHPSLAPVKGNEKAFKGKMQLTGYFHCWSEDKLLRKKYLAAGRFMKTLGIEFLFAHYPDTGNENYQNRCSQCEARFGADRAKADANVGRIIVDAIKETCPDARVVLCPHPYSPQSLRYPELERFLTDLNRQLPADAYVTIRETRKEFIDQWNRLTNNRPLFVYYENRRVIDFRNGRHAGTDKPIFETNARLMKTFLNPGTDAIIMCPWRNKPIDIMAHQEYAWNADAPGAADEFARPPVIYERETNIPEAVTQVYGKIARNLLGHEVGKAFTPLFGLPIIPAWVFQPELTARHVARQRDDDFKAHPFEGVLAERVREQAAFARKAVAIVDNIVESEMPFRNDEAKKVFAHYYKLVHLVDRVVPCRLTHLEARAAMNAGEVAQSRKLIDRGLKEVKAAEEGFKQDLEKIKSWPQNWKGSVHTKAGYAASSYWSMKYFDQFYAEDFRQLSAALDNPNLVKKEANLVPTKLAAKLPKLPVSVRRTAVAPIVDGDLNDECWKSSAEIKPFVHVIKSVGDRVRYPEAATTARVLYDAHKLYFAFTCEEPDMRIDSIVGSEGPRDAFSIFNEDILEIFLQPDPKKYDYCHLVFNVAGRITDLIPKKMPWGYANVTKWNPTWKVKIRIDTKASRWTAEAALPFDALRDEHFNVLQKNPAKGDVWKINLGRERRTMEYSAITVLKNFHERASYRELVFE